MVHSAGGFVGHYVLEHLAVVGACFGLVGVAYLAQAIFRTSWSLSLERIVSLVALTVLLSGGFLLLVLGWASGTETTRAPGQSLQVIDNGIIGASLILIGALCAVPSSLASLIYSRYRPIDVALSRKEYLRQGFYRGFSLGWITTIVTGPIAQVALFADRHLSVIQVMGAGSGAGLIAGSLVGVATGLTNIVAQPVGPRVFPRARIWSYTVGSACLLVGVLLIYHH